MVFELLPIAEDFIPTFGRDTQWKAYGGNWALDTETTDCFYFTGRDVLDPTIPSGYVFSTKNRTERFSVEVSNTRYIPSVYIASLSIPGNGKPDYLVVIKPISEISYDIETIQERVYDAIRVLFKQPELEIYFVPDWSELTRVRSVIEMQRMRLPPPPSHPKAYALGARFGKFLRKFKKM
jgi:hypothetical protein